MPTLSAWLSRGLWLALAPDAGVMSAGDLVFRGHINMPGARRGMVEPCKLQSNLSLFPDEGTSISAALNRDHYRFKQPVFARQYRRVLIE